MVCLVSKEVEDIAERDSMAGKSLFDASLSFFSTCTINVFLTNSYGVLM